MSITLAQINSALDPNSENYKVIQIRTDYIKKNYDPSARNILDVMRNIMHVIPPNIFTEYFGMYEYIINDLYYRAPEDYLTCWVKLTDELIKMSQTHPHEPFIEEVKRIFCGQ